MGVKKDKENAVSEYLEMIKKSWTWGRLTESERTAFLDSVEWSIDQNVIVGTWKQRWMICQALYTTLLYALDYKPFGWREPCVTDN